MLFEFKDLDPIKEAHRKALGESWEVCESIVLLLHILQDESIYPRITMTRFKKGEVLVYNHTGLIGRIYIMKGCNKGHIEFKLHDNKTETQEIPNFRDFFKSCCGHLDTSIFKAVITLMKWKKSDWERRKKNARKKKYDPS